MGAQSVVLARCIDATSPFGYNEAWHIGSLCDDFMWRGTCTGKSVKELAEPAAHFHTAACPRRSFPEKGDGENLEWATVS